MAMRDLIPWSRGNDVSVPRGQDATPLLALHREMNRLFDDAFRGFDLAPFGLADRLLGRVAGWPSIEIGESDKEIRVTAELPGLEEKDVTVEFANGMLVIRGEKKTETQDRDCRFSERYYGQFERRIPVDDVDEDKVTAGFKNGVLTVTLPKFANAKPSARRIAINGK